MKDNDEKWSDAETVALISWEYRSRPNGNDRFVQHRFEQEIRYKRGRMIIPAFCAGVYLSELKCAEWFSSREGLPYSGARVAEEWCRYIRNDSGRAKEGVEDLPWQRETIYGSIVQFYDAVGFLAFAAMRELKLRSKRSLYKELPTTLDTVKLVNLFLCGDEEPNDYERLLEALKRYASKSFIKKYLEDKGRCFALFVGDLEKKAISFSGCLDVLDQDIKKYFSETITDWAPADNFIELAETIAKEQGAELVLLTKEVSTYSVRKKRIVVRDSSLGDVIKKGTLKDCREFYSCCERKLYTFLDKNRVNGILFVKYHLCEQCQRGFFYELQSGLRIMLEEGLIDR